MSLRQRNVGIWLLPLFALATVAYLAGRLRIDADFSAFLPRGLNDTQRVFLKELQEGVATRLLLIELRGEEPPRLAAISRALAERLAQDRTFRYVNNGVDSPGREFELIQRYRYALSDDVTPEKFTPEGLRGALEERLEGLAGSMGALEKKLLSSDPTGETLHVLQKITPSSPPRRIDGVWFNRAGDGALLIAETSAAGSDLRSQEDALRALRRAFDDARDGSPASLRFSSPGAMAVGSRALIASDATRLSVVSAVLVLGILAWFYRSVPVLLLCALPAALGLLAGIAAVNLWFGSVHAITLGFGVTLLGEAVDYPSYLLTQVREGETAAAAVKRIAPTLRLAVLTTACGSLALLMASFTGLAELGLLTMVGVIVAGIATIFIAQWIPARWNGVATHAGLARFVHVPPASTSRQGIVVAMIAATLALAAPNEWWDDDLANMNPLPNAVKEEDRRLRQELGAADVRSLIAVIGDSREAVLRMGERLRPHLVQWVAGGDIGGFDLASDYLPSDAAQAQRRNALPASDQLRVDLAQAATGLPFKTDTFEPFVDAVEEARQAPRLSVESLAGTALGLKLESLLKHDDDQWRMVVPLSGVADVSALSAKVRALSLRAVRLIDLRAEAIGMMSGYRRQALHYGALGSMLIFVVLAHGSRSPRRAARTMLPIFAALVQTAATLVALREPLSVFHLVALLLVLGIGINYALFFQRAVDERDEFARTLQTLAVVSGTTLCAFGTLAFSRTPVLHAIGLTVSLGVVFSLVASALLLGSPATASRRVT